MRKGAGHDEITDLSVLMSMSTDRGCTVASPTARCDRSVLFYRTARSRCGTGKRSVRPTARARDEWSTATVSYWQSTGLGIAGEESSHPDADSDDGWRSRKRRDRRDATKLADAATAPVTLRPCGCRMRRMKHCGTSRARESAKKSQLRARKRRASCCHGRPTPHHKMTPWSDPSMALAAPSALANAAGGDPTRPSP